MKKNYIAIFFLILLSACSNAHKIESPTIYLSNASSDFIKNIKVNWASKANLTLPNLNPGDTRTQSFYLKSKDNFFGEVMVSWNNARGEMLTKNFTIQKIHLPSIDEKYGFNYVQLYFSQTDAEVITSDIIDINGKSKIMDRLIMNYRKEAEVRGVIFDCVPNKLNLYNCPSSGNSASVLIRVQTTD